jgi:hypothetical protein
LRPGIKRSGRALYEDDWRDLELHYLGAAFNAEALAAGYGTSRQTIYAWRRNGEWLATLALQNSPNEESVRDGAEGTRMSTNIVYADTAALHVRLDRMERWLDAIMRDVAETAARVRERFATDPDVMRAVDAYFTEALAGSFTELH